MSAKLTPWFNIACDGQPFYEGRYEIKYSFDGDTVFRYFDGKRWRTSKKGTVCGFGNMKCDFHREYWRGLLKP